MMNGDRGPNGPIGICPKCGKHDGIVWHPETDTCDCICGWRSTPSSEVVMRAFECCLTDDHSHCPYKDDWCCDHNKVEDALAVLREQRAEIERLQSAWLKAQMDAEQERFQCKNICEPTYKNLLETARAENAELVEDIQQCMYYAKPKNNNTCNFCKRDGGEGGHPCKGREDWVDCSPIWRGVVCEKMEGEK